ncbi:MAG: type 1 glutamine amidotransferase domain-containing protein [Chitinophagaceae bacterium]|nr:type 1 glutamine amidotransferase domain-containing protein [Chitinophagaceae bacterium]
MKSTKVLFVATSHENLGETPGRTGAWLEEIATPYYILKDAGAELTLCSPKGGSVPIDPKSQSIIVATSNARRFLKDAEAMSFLANSNKIDEINADDFDLVYLAGGHGAMWDFINNASLTALLEAFNNKNKIVAAICHGVGGLLSIRDEKGELLVKGRKLTCFSNVEEDSSALTWVVPFLLETRLVSLGVLYTKAASYTSHVVVDGNIVTGQNPASAEELTNKVVTILKTNKVSPTFFVRSVA